MTVINIDRQGRVIPDLSKVVIHVDDFPEIVAAARKIMAAKAKEVKQV